MRPEIEPSWMLVGFVTAEPQQKFQMLINLFCFGLFWLFVVVVVCFFRIASMAYGGSQAWVPIGTVAADLHHSHSNVGSEPHLQPTPQLAATPYP